MLWDSGKVESDQNIQIAYGGRALVSRERCWWKARAWDKNGTPSGWSEEAWWEMGLLDETIWSGKWINDVFKSQTHQTGFGLLIRPY